jgi:tripartite-type tricarboxylate transporter receptor subunit TctC
MSPAGGGPDHFARFIQADTKKWADVITAAGLKK